MENEHLITVEEFCVHYNVEYSFLQSLTEVGLLEITTVQSTQYLDMEHIRKAEQLIRLHYDLEINVEGIEAISHLLQRVDSLQEELIQLKNRLSLYERK
ncbi:MAG: chaperone modulator CbpM [Bacteroidia bacterium]|nr:chaperone modulator CbpM [Bacteroidia bacterium]